MNIKRILITVFAVSLLLHLQGQTGKPYVVADFTESDLPKMLELCHQGGFEMLIEKDPFSTYGHYEWNPNFAPEGDKSVKRMVKSAEYEGVTLGLIVQEEFISLNDAYFSQKYFKQYQCSEPLRLFDEITATDVDIALRRSESMKSLSTLNLLLIDDEMVSIGTLEFAGDLVLLHHCTRGLYGTKKASHGVNAKAYKIYDTPDRCVLPAGELLEQVRQNLADRLANTEVSCVLHKGDPGQELLENSVRVRQVESWENDGIANNTLGWFGIHAADKKRAATSMEELEWLLSKSAAFDACYGLMLDPAAQNHGAISEMIEKIKQWNTLTQNKAFNSLQKETMRDPYLDWHLEKRTDSLFNLYPWNFSRRYQCDLHEVDTGLLQGEPWIWNVEEEGGFGLRLQVEGNVDITNPMVNTSKGLLMFPCTIKPGQRLIYDFEEVAYVMDANLKILQEVAIEGVSELAKGDNEVSFYCEVDPEAEQLPVVRLRYITRDVPFVIRPHK